MILEDLSTPDCIFGQPQPALSFLRRKVSWIFSQNCMRPTGIAPSGSGLLTLGHGDAHTANIYFNNKGGGLRDWKIRRLHWYHDVTYFLITSLDVVDRRKWLSALIQYYLDRLAAYGVSAQEFEEAFYCFRRERIYGYIFFITNGDGQQFWSEAMNSAVTVRLQWQLRTMK